MTQLPTRIGGSFAPPLDSSKLSTYRSLAKSAPEEARGYMETLCDMMEIYHDEDESKNESAPHPSGLGTITMLEEDQIKRLWDHVPWPRECDAMQHCFEELPPGELRNAAFHLLWYGKELADDRQPLTNDKLPPRRLPKSEKVQEAVRRIEAAKASK